MSENGTTIFRIRLSTVFIILIVVCAFLPVFQAKTMTDYIFLFLIYLTYIPITFVFGYLLLKLSRQMERIKPPDSNELQREDDVFLQGIAFSQATLFVLLNLVPVPLILEMIRLVIPISASIFFTLRAYAKIKENGIYRFVSTILAIAILFLNVFILVVPILPRLVVADFNVALSYWAWISLILLFFVAFGISKALRIRYGLEVQKTEVQGSLPY